MSLTSGSYLHDPNSMFLTQCSYPLLLYTMSLTQFYSLSLPLFLQRYTDSNGNSDDMDGSSFSSFYSSFIKTTDGSESPPDNDKDMKLRKIKVVLTPQTPTQNVYHIVNSLSILSPCRRWRRKLWNTQRKIRRNMVMGSKY